MISFVICKTFLRRCLKLFFHTRCRHFRYLLPQIGIIILIIKVAQVTPNKLQSPIRQIISSPHHLIFSFLILIFEITAYIKVQTLKNIHKVVDAVEKYEGIGIIPFTNKKEYIIRIKKCLKKRYNTMKKP
jgi:hypothetical protein